MHRHDIPLSKLAEHYFTTCDTEGKTSGAWTTFIVQPMPQLARANVVLRGADLGYKVCLDVFDKLLHTLINGLLTCVEDQIGVLRRLIR